VSTASLGATSNNAPAVTKAIQIKSNLVLSSITADWAVANRDAVTETLRKTMGLSSDEELLITSISKLGRQLAAERKLQSGGGVKIDFVIGVNDQARASIAENKVTQLASGSPALAMQFAAVLDQELQARGQAPVALSVNDMAFAAPTKTMNTYTQSTQVYSASGSGYNNQNNVQQAPADNSSNDGMLMGLIVGAFAMSIMGFVMFMYFSKQQAKAHSSAEWKEEPTEDVYASKVAALDTNWQQDLGELQTDQSAW
jgi:hypothetical protein